MHGGIKNRCKNTTKNLSKVAKSGGLTEKITPPIQLLIWLKKPCSHNHYK
jgi:hypothetical protein